jgi:hypothetical protein
VIGDGNEPAPAEERKPAAKAAPTQTQREIASETPPARLATQSAVSSSAVAIVRRWRSLARAVDGSGGGVACTCAGGGVKVTVSLGRCASVVASEEEKLRPSVPPGIGRRAQPPLGEPEVQARRVAVTSMVKAPAGMVAAAVGAPTPFLRHVQAHWRSPET